MKTSKDTKYKTFSNSFKNWGNVVNLRKTISRAAIYRDDRHRNVINLSKHSFTKNLFKVLNKNLNLSPRPGYYNKKEIKAT